MQQDRRHGVKFAGVTLQGLIKDQAKIEQHTGDVLSAQNPQPKNEPVVAQAEKTVAVRRFDGLPPAWLVILPIVVAHAAAISCREVAASHAITCSAMSHNVCSCRPGSCVHCRPRIQAAMSKWKQRTLAARRRWRSHSQSPSRRPAVAKGKPPPNDATRLYPVAVYLDFSEIWQGDELPKATAEAAWNATETFTPVRTQQSAVFLNSEACAPTRCIQSSLLSCGTVTRLHSRCGYELSNRYEQLSL